MLERKMSKLFNYYSDSFVIVPEKYTFLCRAPIGQFLGSHLFWRGQAIVVSLLLVSCRQP